MAHVFSPRILAKASRFQFLRNQSFRVFGIYPSQKIMPRARSTSFSFRRLSGEYRSQARTANHNQLTDVRSKQTRFCHNPPHTPRIAERMWRARSRVASPLRILVYLEREVHRASLLAVVQSTDSQEQRMLPRAGTRPRFPPLAHRT